MLLCSVACTANKKGRRGVGLGMTGTSILNEEVFRWQQRTLRVNDVVPVKIIETNEVDEPKLLQNGFPKKKPK